jgi:FXSXX-COOH protein
MSDDIADRGLVDVSALTLSELRDERDESSLARALSRILSASEEDRHYGFQNSI